MIVDSHCHLDRLDFEKLGLDLSEVLDQARARDIEHFLCVSVTLDEFPAMLERIMPYSDVSASCGVHPLDIKAPLSAAKLIDLATHSKVVAIGETGLDYYYSQDSKELQWQSFETHIEVANQLNKPLIVHTRDARKDTIDILRSGQAEKAGGVLHCFTENWEMAKQALDLGFYISISGIATFKNATDLREVVRQIPIDRLLVETDSPYLAPVPYRGKTNQPAYVRDVAEYLAELKGVSKEAFFAQTTENYYTLFSLSAR